MCLNFCDFKLSKGFLYLTTKTQQQQKEKQINQMSSKLKTFVNQENAKQDHKKMPFHTHKMVMIFKNIQNNKYQKGYV